MAEEIRWALLTNVVADGTTAANGNAEHKNGAARDMFIRIIKASHSYNTAAAGESGLAEICKFNVLSSNTSDFSDFCWAQEISAPSTGATPADGNHNTHDAMYFARGQLILEENESLFANVLKSSGGALRYRYLIGYHYE